MSSVEEGKIYVYGISEDVSINSAGSAANELDLILKIGNYLTPSASYDSSVYNW